MENTTSKTESTPPRPSALNVDQETIDKITYWKEQRVREAQKKEQKKRIRGQTTFPNKLAEDFMMETENESQIIGSTEYDLDFEEDKEDVETTKKV